MARSILLAATLAASLIGCAAPGDDGYYHSPPLAEYLGISQAELDARYSGRPTGPLPYEPPEPGVFDDLGGTPFGEYYDRPVAGLPGLGREFGGPGFTCLQTPRVLGATNTSCY